MLNANLILVFLLIFVLLKNHFHKNKGIVFSVLGILSFYVKILAISFDLSEIQQHPIILRLVLFHGFIGYLTVPFMLLYLQTVFKKQQVFSTYIYLSIIPLLIMFIYYIPFSQLPLSDKIALFENPHFQLSNASFLLIPYSTACIINDIVNPMMGIIVLASVYKNLNFYKQILSKKTYYLIVQIGSIFVINFIIISIITLYKYCFDLQLIKTEIFGILALASPLSYMLFPNYVYDISLNSDLGFYLSMMNRISPEVDEEPINQELVLDTNRIINFLNQEKPYLSADFSIHDIVKQLDIPQKRVTDCFNKVIKIPFPKMRNQLRVNHATSLFKSNEHLNKSIFGVASESGFKNRATFYNAFKEVKKTTPVGWIKHNCDFVGDRNLE
ncbi:helix-turn-helix domain-containing protein [Aquirufa sp. ROCK2-A2]